MTRAAVRTFLLDTVVRPFMLVLWLCVFWGTFLLFAWAYSFLRHGSAETMRRLTPVTGDLPAVANVVLPLLALVVWTAAGLAWRRARRDRPVAS